MMRALLILGLLSLARGQLSDCTCSYTTTVTETVEPSSTSPSKSGAASAVTVATDKSGQFTAIGDAISYAQHNEVPTVTVLAGTYPAVTVSATPSVAVIGESKSDDDSLHNKVVVSEEGTALTLSVNVDGITFQNLNFANTGPDDPAVNIKGSKLAFYACQFVSAGPVGIETGLGVGIIANSYIEAQETAIDGQATLYIFNTDIALVEDSAIVAYTTGTDLDGTLYNSTIVFDEATVSPKPDDQSDRGYLAKAKGLGSVVIYRGSALDGFIADTGVYVDDITQDASNLYGEYADTGSGAYPSNKNARSPYVTRLDDSSISQFALSAVFAGAYPDFATTDTNWIDPTVLDKIDKADGTSPAGTSTGSGSSPSSTSLTSADASSSPLVVSADSSVGQYTSVQDAISALPDDGKPYVIEIKSGVYKEQISITRSGMVTLRGETTFKNDFTKNTVTIEFEDGVATTTNNDAKTPVINVKDTDGKAVVALYNINFQNTYPQSGNTVALAADFDGLVAAYGCSFIGYHHTLLANKGTQVLSNSYIEGSMDFIWGSSIAYFHQSFIATNTPGYSIAAQDRSSAKASGGFVFDASVVTYTTSYGSSFGKSYLGRASTAYSLVIYMNSFLDKQISAVGWSSEGEGAYDVTFGEYNNSGPGSPLDDRASFAKALTKSEAESYTLTSWIGDTSWLDMTAYGYVPSYDLSSGTDGASPTAPDSATGTSAAKPSATDGASPTDVSGADTATGSSTSPSGTGTAGHPDSGTKPPTGAVLVSVLGTIDNSFSSLTDALKSLPSDDSVQVIFIYAGTYHEQVPSIDREGPVKVIGYTQGNPGQSYSDNEVTITFSSGLPMFSGSSDSFSSSDSGTATISTTSSNIAFYNINIINSDNLDGSQASHVAVAASISGSRNGFYACSFIGWQETLLTGCAAALQYYESSYIEGAVDFISGSSTAYFKGCTLGAKLKGAAITAQSRQSEKAGGYIFDQCLFGAAADATGDLTSSVYLGRPRSEYALVVIKMSHLTDIINPSGWTVWSSTDPQTDHITFAEYKNTGPGNWENNADARQAFGSATLLSSDTYTLSDVMGSTNWIDLTYWDSITTPNAEPGAASSPGTPTTTSDSTTPSDDIIPSDGASPSDGTTPPDGALIVSKTSIANKKIYDTIQSALDALPTSASASSTVFIYPGTYDEQIVITAPGTVILVGYSEATSDNEQNQVIIQNNRAGNPSLDDSLTSSATVYADGNNLQVVNINFSNTHNGTDDASVAFAVAPSKYASLYSCRVTGNRNALVVDSFLFAANSYIEGSQDMISGSGAGYFLNSTISPNDDGISITADRRASSSTSAGIIFDQCKVTPVGGAGAMSEISLGRPQNSNARVAYIETHLGSCIEPKGWEKWSEASPRTDGVLFGEFKNDGPGSDTSQRVPFTTQLTNTSVLQFEIGNFFDRLSWIDFSHVYGKPFSVEPSSPSSTSPDSGSSSAASSTSPDAAASSSDPAGSSPTDASSPEGANDSSSSSLASADPSGSNTITTSTILVTTTSSVTITDATATSVETRTKTLGSGSTITPAPVFETTTENGRTTIIETYTSAESTKTVTKTSTTMNMVSDKATYTRTVTSTTTITSTPQPATTTSTLTITSGPGATSTKTGKTTVLTTSVTSTKTKTESMTTTLNCIPARTMKRNLLPPRSVPATRSTNPTKITGSAMTTSMASNSPELGDSTTTTNVRHVKITMSFVTSTVTETKTATIAADTAVATVTEDAGDAVTLDPETLTSTITSPSSTTSTTTVTASVATITSFTTTTAQSTVGPAPSTVILIVVTQTSTSTLFLPASTLTETKTTTYNNTPTTTITSRPTSTKTKTVKTITTTTTSTVTATSEDATTCAS
ncbi:Pectinesterase catalytic [Penicillium sp. IBT 35674x]|nr:Pectinesterase catalytic [Penicillium sp. IBT 35674x]